MKPEHSFVLKTRQNIYVFSSRLPAQIHSKDDNSSKVGSKSFYVPKRLKSVLERRKRAFYAFVEKSLHRTISPNLRFSIAFYRAMWYRAVLA